MNKYIYIYMYTYTYIHIYTYIYIHIIIIHGGLTGFTYVIMIHELGIPFLTKLYNWCNGI